jgi:hypothetical protein
VGDCHGPIRGDAQERLRVLPPAAAGGGIPDMPDGSAPRKLIEGIPVKDVRNQTHVLAQ